MKALAVSSAKRLASLPNVPTVAEVAVPGFEFSLWGGYFAPQGTPDAIVNRLNAEITRVLAEPDVHARFEADGSAVAPMSPSAFEAFVRAETEKYAKLVKATGAQID